VNVVLPAATQGVMGNPTRIALINGMGKAGACAAYANFHSALAESKAPFEFLHVVLDRDAGVDTALYAINQMADDGMSGVIVTGMEPEADLLSDEWVWPILVRLHDRCERDRTPVIWSCLAAHVAVLYRSGLSRRRLTTKLSGLFACSASAVSHPFLKKIPSEWVCAHSRYNTLDAETLERNGYVALSRADIAGVDIFTRSDDIPFLYFQGHPEYQPDTLLREYARDVRRFRTGILTTPPAIPIGYEQACHTAPQLSQEEGAKAILSTSPSLCDELWRTRREIFGSWLQLISNHQAALEPAIAPR